MRPSRQVVIDGLVIALLASVWLYEFSQRGSALVFGALGVVIVALLYSLIQRAKAPPQEDVVQQPMRRSGKRLATLCLVLVVLVMVMMGPQLLAARSVSVYSVPSVNERGRNVLTSHLLLGKHDLAWVRAELEGEGAISTHTTALTAVKATLRPLRPQVAGMLGADQGLVFEWEMRFGWPFAVRSWSEMQAVGPGGERWSMASGQK